jgi:hypothetical protein
MRDDFSFRDSIGYQLEMGIFPKAIGAEAFGEVPLEGGDVLLMQLFFRIIVVKFL